MISSSSVTPYSQEARVIEVEPCEFALGHCFPVPETDVMRLRIFQCAAFAAALVFIGLTGGSVQAYHDTRVVIVNGARLSPAEIVYAEQATGYRLPSGYYWYDEASGYWGVVGGPAVGRVAGTYAQGSGVGETYGDGSSAYRNPNTGTGIITNPNGGGDWRDQVWVSPR